MNAVKPLSTVDAFLKGYKPAFLEVPNRVYTTEKLDLLLSKYPYVNEKDYDLLEGRQFFLFFQDEKACVWFQEELERRGLTKGDIDRLLGISLGFPPKAVDYYVKMQTAKRNGNLELYERMKNRKINMNYCGCLFSSDVYDFVENTLWLLERYPYSEAKEAGMYIRIGLEPRVRVSIGNYQQIVDFKEYIIEQIGVVSV